MQINPGPARVTIVTTNIPHALNFDTYDEALSFADTIHQRVIHNADTSRGRLDILVIPDETGNLDYIVIEQIVSWVVEPSEPLDENGHTEQDRTVIAVANEIRTATGQPPVNTVAAAHEYLVTQEQKAREDASYAAQDALIDALEDPDAEIPTE